MKPIRMAALAAACTFAAYAPAGAADLRGQPSLKDAPYVDNTPTYRYYLGIKGGWTFPQDTDFNALGLNLNTSYDTGYVISGVAGVELSRSSAGRLRGDIEAGYSSANASGGSAFGRTGITFGLASLYYDFETGTVFKPFIGAGGGIAGVDFKNHGFSPIGTLLNSSDTAYAYHLTAGASVALSASTEVELAYRYFGTTGAELRAVDGTRTSVDTGDHQIMLGLRQKF